MIIINYHCKPFIKLKFSYAKCRNTHCIFKLKLAVRLWRGRQLKLPGRIQASINEHRVLLAAIAGGGPERAERAMHDHLMAQLAALKALQTLEARRLQA